MGIRATPQLPHWNYFLALEEDLARLSRYVEFAEPNESTYSLEIGRLLLAASSEVDVVLKQLCRRYDSSAKASSIGRYFDVVSVHEPALLSFGTRIRQFGRALTPFQTWKRDTPPLWWTATNKFKHHRDTAFDRATLKNTLNAVAALFITVLFLYPEEARGGHLVPPARLLDVEEERSLGQFGGRDGIVPCFDVGGGADDA